ncbi:MAG: DUF559 domain-containing protein [Planctomycetota bacterium]
MNSRQHSQQRSGRRSEPTAFAREQRSSSNEFARDVWEMVRNRRCRGQKFRREHPIPQYTADFCCVALKLIVEVDGKHHLTDEGQEHDAARDKFLAEQGYEVLRIPGFRVTQDPRGVRFRIERVVESRLDAIGSLTPGPSPSTS